MKSSKAYRKRLKVSKHGKVRGRAKGQNHFNAKESGRARQKKKRPVAVLLKRKTINRYLS